MDSIKSKGKVYMKKLSYEELIKENQELKVQLQFYQDYDNLTGLYNKNTFYQKSRQKLKQYPKEKFNIVCVDIERFKLVNDLYGSEVGDSLLKYVADQLRSAFSRDTTILARISADIYAILLQGQIETDEIERVIRNIFKGYPSDIKIVPAIGIYPVVDINLPMELMCDRAILALNTIKGNYMKHIAVYDSSIRHELLEENEILSRADEALLNNEFKVFIQPKCSMITGKVVGAEALIRWEHPARGLVSPGAFIPVFEKNGFIKKLDIFMWKEVARWIRNWINQGNNPVPISVNVSRIDILGMDVFQILNKIIKMYEIDPEWLEVEVTESAYMNRPEPLIQTIERLMQSGFTISMDDFGSGYSSLNILKDINVDILKLDMRFLENENQKSKDIVESVLHMAKWLNLRVIAEGVETKSQVDFLLDIGCEYAQGYYYYKPMPIEQFEQLLLQNDKVDYESELNTGVKKTGLISFKDLFHEDVMTDRLLNNILGGVALYEYDGDIMNILQCNEEYYQIVYRNQIPENEYISNVMDCIIEEDRSHLKWALEKVGTGNDKGVEVSVRRQLSKDRIIWIQMRLFYLSKVKEKKMYYAAISDVTAEMQALEELQLSEQRFRVAMDATNNTLFEVDIATKTARYAEHSMDDFGLDDCVANAPEGFIEQGAVCQGYEDTFRSMYESIYEGADRASCIIKANMNEGKVVWNRITLTAIKDKKGKSIKAIGLVENVTREKELENRLREQA